MPPKKRKNEVLRKVSVIRDEMKLPGSGIYCFLPFENIDKNKSAVYKIGMTEKQIYQRIEQYHTYFPSGVWIAALLIGPQKLRKGRTLRTYYEEIEEYLVEEALKLKAQPVFTTTRIRKSGRSEWIYIKEEVLHDIFNMAHVKYGGKLHLYHTHDLNANSKRMRNKYRHYTGEVDYPLEPVK